MTRQEFIGKYRAYLAGRLALGSGKMRQCFSGAFTAAEFGKVMTELTDTTDETLGTLYDGLMAALAKSGPEQVSSVRREPQPATKPGANGTPAQPPRATHG